MIDLRKKRSFWPFLQLDDEGRILDRFCTCNEAEKKEECPHFNKALERIFLKGADPLHVRHRESLWNQLCWMAALRHGFDPGIFKKGKDLEVALFSQTGKELFSLQAQNASGKRTIEKILFERRVETEETSLKFSKLPFDELKLWREGRPSLELQYELSFWADLSKRLFELQEKEKKYEIHFEPSLLQLPKRIRIVFLELFISFYIAEVNWERLIPSLSTVKSPLLVYEIPRRAIEKIFYDKEKKSLFIEHAKIQEERREAQKRNEQRIGEWIFIPNHGFYPASFEPLLLEKEVKEERIGALLHNHPRLLEKYLVNEPIHRGFYSLSYLLELTEQRGLIISSYLLEAGDLERPLSARFNHWVYVEEKGFYQVKAPLFEEKETSIPLNRLSDFVFKHRNFLNQFSGFEIHLSAIEAQLSFSVSEEGSLSIKPHFELLEEEKEAMDVGAWIYLKDKGFYLKMTRAKEAFLKEGECVLPEKVSSFIHRYKEELELCPLFFTQEEVLERVALDISLSSKGSVVVTPRYLFKKGVDSSKVKLYHDLIFREGKGFSWIPSEMRLPEQYTQERIISSLDLHHFLSFELKALFSFIRSLDPRLTAPKWLSLRLHELKRDTKTTMPTWIVRLTYESDLGEVLLMEIWKALAERKRHLFSNAGLLFFPQQRFNWLKGLSGRKFLQKGKFLRLTTLDWVRLSVLEKMQEPSGDTLKGRRTLKLLESFRAFETKEPLNPEGLLSKLRPYQETGSQWLWFLYSNGLSGLLCDDMGLGKTHQAMALLASAKNYKGEAKGKYLVVCPTSVLYHWEELLRRYLPSMQAALFHGPFRKLPKSYDLLLTSYGIVRSERELLSSMRFDIVIFDELQAAKNPKSQTHRVLKTLDANMRVGLTGTPIENRLMELKALFDIVIPTYLPAESHFRQLFVNPIEKNQDQEKIGLLRKLIRPFILRRKKKEVLFELPEKSEEIAYCPLSEEQRLLYEEVVTGHKEGLLNKLKNREEPVPYLHIFSLLSTLKQICDHPALYHQRLEEASRHRSGKWELYSELLQESLDSGQKLVVFSQYLGMLDIIEADLREKKIAYAAIRGSTRDRKTPLERFRDDPSCAVFVASLKAAGVGIDLTAASVVIHYDRWWNPAKENQATDRVHRIGQSRGVQVFKMVTKGSIEEHIHSLIEKKKGLAEQAIAYDDQDQIKTLDREELIELLGHLELPVESGALS